MKTRSLLLAAVFLSAILTVRAGPIVNQYFPMNNGDNRYYQDSANNSSTATEFFTQTTYNGHAVFRLNFHDEWDVYLLASHTWYLANNGGALALYGINTIWGNLPFDSPANLFTDQTLSNNGTLTSTVTGVYYVASLGNVTFNITVRTTVSSIPGTITVPAGTFANCKLIEVLETATVYGVFQQTYDSAAWVVAPGVGIIEDGVAVWDLYTGQFTSDNGVGGSVDFLELVSGEINNVPIVSVTTPAITSPTPNSTLTSSSVTFRWSSGTGVTNYGLYVGSRIGTNDIFSKSTGLNLSTNVSNLPVNGSTLYVRLWWATAAAGWQHVDYTYTAALPSTQPDLTKGTDSLTYRSPHPGDIITPSITITNEPCSGAGGSAGAFNIGFYWSTSSNFSGVSPFYEAPIASCAANGTVSLNQSIIISAPTVLGTYYLGYRINDENEVAECNTNNNGIFYWTITVTAGPPPLAFKHTGTNFVLSWPTNTTGVLLEYSTNLSSKAWATNSASIYLLNGQYVITNAISKGSRFYRLLKP
jgi:hypothetical protein